MFINTNKRNWKRTSKKKKKGESLKSIKKEIQSNKAAERAYYKKRGYQPYRPAWNNFQDPKVVQIDLPDNSKKS